MQTFLLITIRNSTENALVDDEVLCTDVFSLIQWDLWYDDNELTFLNTIKGIFRPTSLSNSLNTYLDQRKLQKFWQDYDGISSGS